MSTESAGSPLVRLVALGARFDVHTAGPDAEALAARVTEAWSRCLAEEDDPDAGKMLVLDTSPEADSSAGVLTGSADQVMSALSSEITMAAIEAQAGRSLMFHAGALAHPETGQAVVLVGPSGAGKTTAVTSLAARYGYLTDETVAVEAGGWALAYPKPLSVIVDPHEVKRQMSPDELSLGATPRGAHVAGVVLLERDGSRVARLAPAATLDAMALLAPHTSYLSRLDSPLHWLADLLDRVGGLSVAHYAESSDLHPLVADLLDRRG